MSNNPLVWIQKQHLVYLFVGHSKPKRQGNSCLTEELIQTNTGLYYLMKAFTQEVCLLYSLFLSRVSGYLSSCMFTL